MTTQTTAQQALEQARAITARSHQQHYRAQVAEYRPAAQTAFQEVIKPWWAAFATSPEAAQIRHRLGSEERSRVAIAHPVRYMGPKGDEWEAIVMLEQADPLPPVRELVLRVGQLREGRPVSSYAGALLAHHMRRTIPPGIHDLRQLDLHPIVLVDFAEQIQAYTVQAHIKAIADGR